MKSGMVSIIIPHWNGVRLIEDCLQSIKEKTKYKNYEVIVIDNHSTDGSVELLKEMKKNGFVDKLILNRENTGFAYANNQGFEIAEGEYFYMLSNDTLLNENWLKNVVQIAESDKKIGCVGSTVISPGQQIKENQELGEKRTVCGAAMLMKRKVTDKIGVLDAENFSPVYGEETDWCFRCRNAGYRVVESGASVVVHIGSVSAKKRSGLKWQYVTMNTHRLKAMLFNLTLPDIISFAPGLGLIFVKSIFELRTHWLVESYWNNIKISGKILKERKKRHAKLF